MQKVIYRNQIENYKKRIDQSIINYIEEGLIETFEGFRHHSLVAFDWYNIANVEEEPSQIILYLDKEDFVVICENEVSYEVAKKYFSDQDSNEKAMYTFFKNMFKGDTKNLERLEDRISKLDDEIIAGTAEDARQQIVDLRYEVLRLKKYYEQFELVFDELCDNDNGLISVDNINYFEVLRNRTDRMISDVMNLREFMVQVRESYQAQIDIEQNHLMKIFTLVTSIFLPLTLIAGWYGMNLKMPEVGWDYSYPVVIVVSIVVCLVWIWVFKKKGWFK